MFYSNSNPNPAVLLTYVWLFGLDEAQAKGLTLGKSCPRSTPTPTMTGLRARRSVVELHVADLALREKSKMLGLALTKRYR